MKWALFLGPSTFCHVRNSISPLQRMKRSRHHLGNRYFILTRHQTYQWLDIRLLSLSTVRNTFLFFFFFNKVPILRCSVTTIQNGLRQPHFKFIGCCLIVKCTENINLFSSNISIMIVTQLWSWSFIILIIIMKTKNIDVHLIFKSTYLYNDIHYISKYWHLFLIEKRMRLIIRKQFSQVLPITAIWLWSIQLIFLVFHFFICKLGFSNWWVLSSMSILMSRLYNNVWRKMVVACFQISSILPLKIYK